MKGKGDINRCEIDGGQASYGGLMADEGAQVSMTESRLINSRAGISLSHRDTHVAVQDC